MLVTEEQIRSAFATDDAELQRAVYAAATHPYYTFEPRPDSHNDRDEQTGFVECNYHWSEADRCYLYDDVEHVNFKICLGGNGSGKTICAAQKSGRHVLETPPPRESCPFWIIGEQMDQVCKVAWTEKLREIIPDQEILGVIWHRRDREWPRAVILRHPQNRSHRGWVLEFKSYEQGIGAMKGESIGGYWFNEEVPYPLVLEVQARCREYDSPGWADFTPVEAKADWKEKYEDPPIGWRFYHLNSLMNSTLPEGFIERYLESLPEDMRDLRQFGDFTSFYGQIFKEFSKAVHVRDFADPRAQEELGLWRRPPYVPHDWYKILGVDFGFNTPTAVVWVARDRDRRYYVYDEHYKNQWLVHQHVEAIKARHWDESDPHYGPRYCEHGPLVQNEYARLGIGMTNALKSPNEGIALLRTLMLTQRDGRPRFYIHAGCKALIKELQNMRWHIAKADKNAKDEEVDKDNHCLAAGTMVTTSRGPVRIEQVKPGDRALTRQGFKPVLWSGPTRFDMTHYVTLSNGVKIRATNEHPFWTKGRGWTRLSELRPGDELLSAESIFCRTPSELYSAECPIEDTRIQGAASSAYTSLRSEAIACTKLFGSTVTAEKSRAVSTFTTKTATSLTMRRPISFAYEAKSTCLNTAGNCGRRTGGATLRLSCENATERTTINCTPGGTQRKEKSDCRKQQRKPGNKYIRIQKLASFAEESTKPASRRETSFVLITAGRQPGGGVCVVSVRPAQLEQTYDLTIEDAPEFFANGVLVHNSCDALRYAILTDHIRSQGTSMLAGKTERDVSRFGIVRPRRHLAIEEPETTGSQRDRDKTNGNGHNGHNGNGNGRRYGRRFGNGNHNGG